MTLSWCALDSRKWSFRYAYVVNCVEIWPVNYGFGLGCCEVAAVICTSVGFFCEFVHQLLYSRRMYVCLIAKNDYVSLHFSFNFEKWKYMGSNCQGYLALYYFCVSKSLNLCNLHSDCMNVGSLIKSILKGCMKMHTSRLEGLKLRIILLLSVQLLSAWKTRLSGLTHIASVSLATRQIRPEKTD